MWILCDLYSIFSSPLGVGTNTSSRLIGGLRARTIPWFFGHFWTCSEVVDNYFWTLSKMAEKSRDRSCSEPFNCPLQLNVTPLNKGFEIPLLLFHFVVVWFLAFKIHLTVYLSIVLIKYGMWDKWKQHEPNRAN